MTNNGMRKKKRKETRRKILLTEKNQGKEKQKNTFSKKGSFIARTVRHCSFYSVCCLKEKLEIQKDAL